MQGKILNGKVRLQQRLHKVFYLHIGCWEAAVICTTVGFSIDWKGFLVFLRKTLWTQSSAPNIWLDGLRETHTSRFSVLQTQFSFESEERIRFLCRSVVELQTYMVSLHLRWQTSCCVVFELDRNSHEIVEQSTSKTLISLYYTELV